MKKHTNYDIPVSKNKRLELLIFQVYLVIAFLMILLCIFVTALSTEPRFQRKLTKCEMLEYLDVTKNQYAAKISKHFNGTDCNQGSVFEYHDDDYFDDDDYALVEKLENETNKTSKISLRTLYRRMAVFDILEYITTAFFTLDFVMRLLTCPSIRQYCTSVMTWIDIIALAGYYVHLAITASYKEHIYNDGWIKAVNYLQVFRILRLFRVVRNVRASRVLKFSLRQNLRDLTLLAMLLLVAVSVSASLIYFMEPRDRIESISSGAYWAVITLTTVGYGDVTPVTGAGRVLASIMAICGVLLLSITLPMFVNNFLTLYQYTNLDEYIDNKRQTRMKLTESVDAISVINVLEHSHQSHHETLFEKDKLSGDHTIEINAYGNSTIPGSTDRHEILCGNLQSIESDNTRFCFPRNRIH
ncbi:hypothetical protein DPMN_109889 [Dreissena polymorpha]|uniref:Ion transport domain-containing protein n=1 Tax=Dreissena polymorpha TaxID=45954 RepID=A0A9D4QMG3_DREPO|nr:hypothetical protein DPMN_109889 [Dreissena polymorpha]